MEDFAKKQSGESYVDYFVRLFDNKKIYGLTCDQIAELLNTESGQTLGESAYRKEFAAFNRGRNYEREIAERGVATRVLSISDLHFPFAKPIETFSKYVGRVDILQLNGDIFDCQSISKFSKSYRIPCIEELVEGRQYIIDLNYYIKPKKVIANYGNHELRLGAYLANHLDSDLQELMPETALDYIFVDGFYHYDRRNHIKTWFEPLRETFDDIEVVYTGEWFSQIGHVMFVHPKAFSSSPMKTAEKAVLWFRNEGYDFNCLVMAHTHRLGSYKIGNTTMYEQGAACETQKMRYGDGALVNSQQQGCIYVCLDKDGYNIESATKLVAF